MAEENPNADAIQEPKLSIYRRRSLESQFPLIKSAEVAVSSGGYGNVALDFDYPMTVIGFNSTARDTTTPGSAGSPHIDFRVEIESNRGHKAESGTGFQNIPFSARALTKNGKGFWFIEEIGTPMFVQKGEQLYFTFHNDTGVNLVCSFQFVCLRGWVTDFGGIKYDPCEGLGVEKDYPLQGIDLIPTVIVIKPDTTIAHSANGSKTYKFSSGCYTIIRLNTAVEGTLANVQHKDFNINIELPGEIFQNTAAKYISALILSKNNEGFDFSKINGMPFLAYGADEDKIIATFYNYSGATITPSLELITYRKSLTDKALEQIFKARMSA